MILRYVSDNLLVGSL